MDNSEKTENKNKSINNIGQYIMLIGVIVCILICVFVFTFLGVYLSNNTKKTVDDIGEKTMTDSSNQFTLHYEAVLKQRLTMVEAMVEDYKASVDEGKPMSKTEFGKIAERRDFNYLGFLDVNEDPSTHDDPEDGRTLDLIIENDFIVLNLRPFRQAILAGEKKIAIGYALGNNNDEQIVMFSYPTDAYTMSNGNKSRALVAGISMNSFIEMFNINSINKENTVSYIVRNDVLVDDNGDPTGETNSLILKRAADEGYDSLSALFKSRYSKSDKPVETILAELNKSMAEGKPYSNIFRVDDKYIHMFCNKLDMSEWYLVSLTNNAELKAAIGALNNQWILMTVVSVAVIIVILAAIFMIYNHFNKKTMEQLDHARQAAIEANKAKSEFLSNMSHDIRTPMNAIVGMTAIATANIDNKAQVQDCLKKITLSSKHLLGLINDVLDMSKIESGKMTLNMEQISLREVLDGLSTIVQPQIRIKRQKFDMYIHDIITENVYCDSVRLNQVLLNLMSNAMKFTPENGSIEVALRQEPSPLGDGYVRNFIDVSDTGIGMTPEFLKKIFDSFTREDNARVHKTEGTGLGMAITKYIVDAMRGTIEVTSELGKGTQFHVVLDLEKVEAVEEELILPDWKMLVVDDDEQLCRTTVDSLKSIGVRGEWVLTGEEAVDKTVAAHDSGEWYNIILLDWKLPGIDGIETARQIRKKLGNEIPILLISAYDWSEMEHEAREAGISGFISKPLFKSTLYYGLRKFVSDDNGETVVAAPQEKSNELVGKRILIAEDNDLNWEIAEMLLEDAGIIAERAENGKICVDMLKASAPGTYDAVLMDIRMPIMNGYDATTAIRALDRPDKDLPIVAMTADAFADDMKRCLECGMNAHISKPIDIDLLKATLKKFIK